MKYNGFDLPPALEQAMREQYFTSTHSPVPSSAPLPASQNFDTVAAVCLGISIIATTLIMLSQILPQLVK